MQTELHLELEHETIILVHTLNYFYSIYQKNQHRRARGSLHGTNLRTYVNDERLSEINLMLDTTPNGINSNAHPCRNIQNAYKYLPGNFKSDYSNQQYNCDILDNKEIDLQHISIP